MNNKKLANPLLVGIIYCFVGILLSFTFIVPLIHFILGIITESILTFFVRDLTNPLNGKMMIILLSLILVLYLFFNTRSILKTLNSSGYLTKTAIFSDFFLLHFIVHPLVFYCRWGLNTNFRGDGQLILDVVPTDIYANVFLFIYSFLLFILQILLHNRMHKTNE